jgi:hypothetical protein
MAQFPALEKTRLPEGTAGLWGRRDGTPLGWVRQTEVCDVPGVNCNGGMVSNRNREVRNTDIITNVIRNLCIFETVKYKQETT